MSNRPIPTPGPKPGKQASSGRVPVTPVVLPASNPADFGRVEADGEAYGTAVDGSEFHLGSYKAGSPEEGLAMYGKRFDDLACEVELFASRLASHPQEANHIKQQATQVQEQLPNQAVIGDLPRLAARLTEIIAACETTAAQQAELRAKQKQDGIARKTALADEAVELGEHSTEWKKTGDRFGAILQEWKTIRGIDRATDDKLWKRYSQARETFNRRRGAHFAELDRSRQQVARVKEDIIARAEALQDSTDWRETSAKFRDLMTEWKQAGRAQRDVDDKLWARFKQAQDRFFAARNADQQQRDEEFQANAAKKQALLDRYTPLIDPDHDLEGARKTLRELQDEWEAVGFVPRNQVREFEHKIRALEDKVAAAADAQWRRTDPEVQARVAQFVAKVEEFTAQAAQAEAKGNTAKAEQLRAQAAQWQQWADAAQQAVES
ncbi:DUF349 domain-containing protein [Corynebacterium choanae]|uniref:DUF349 domain-containing protein n=1 Tax=Corynebacterium choanae TaxID=1862358 RepID=A0A3G6JB47_9CORY|nr:DUF349 domain-containing protein [Corynebacterium choanae]AZA13780.1 hypothetical protein CCHOA_06940 [Corynebacterium choanae]